MLGAGLFQGKIRAVVSTLGAARQGRDHRQGGHQARPDEALLRARGQGGAPLQRRASPLEAGDSALLDGGTPHGWENLGTRKARALWVILGLIASRRRQATWQTAAIAGRSTSAPSRRGTSTGSSPSTAAWPRWPWTCSEDGGLRPGLRAQAQLLRPRRRHRALRRHPAAALRAPRGRRGHPHLGQGARLLRGRQHPHAEPVLARLEGELLQVHQRDAQRASRRPRPSRARPTSARSTAPARAAATSWRWPADHIIMADDGNTSVSLPEVPLLAVLPGHRRPHAAGRQAPGAPRPRRLLLHARGGHQGPAGGGVGPGRRGRAALEARGDGPQRARPSWPPRSDRPAGARGHRAHAARAHASRATASPTAT